MIQESLKIIKTNKKVAVIAAVLIVVIGYGAYQAYLYFNNKQKEISKIQSDLAEMKTLFGELANNNTLLQEALNNAQQRGELLESTVKELSSDVGVFKKLSELDPELLKKYSKVYFLSENYVPSDLSAISQGYLYSSEKTIQLHSQVLTFLYDMIEDAKRDDIDLLVLSGYRSFGDQLGLKSDYVVRYGSGTANSFSAEQGYSEHQLGTTVDFTTKSLSGKLGGFDKTAEYKWLTENAHKFGFTLSYPPNNSYYTFEPWHWRFVGGDLARYLYNRNLHFYDMAQRDIDEYLIDIFEE